MRDFTNILLGPIEEWKDYQIYIHWSGQAAYFFPPSEVTQFFHPNKTILHNDLILIREQMQKLTQFKEFNDKLDKIING